MSVDVEAVHLDYLPQWQKVEPAFHGLIACLGRRPRGPLGSASSYHNELAKHLHAVGDVLRKAGFGTSLFRKWNFGEENWGAHAHSFLQSVNAPTQASVQTNPTSSPQDKAKVRTIEASVRIILKEIEVQERTEPDFWKHFCTKIKDFRDQFLATTEPRTIAENRMKSSKRPVDEKSNAEDPYLEFPRLQRKLILALGHKGSVKMSDVMKAVYRQTVTIGRLEKLMRRTTATLTHQGIPEQIRRKGMALSLVPITDD